MASGRSVVVLSAWLVLASGLASAAALAESQVEDAELGSDTASLLRPTWIDPRRSDASSDDATADVAVDETSTSQQTDSESVESASDDTEIAGADADSETLESEPSVQARAAAETALDKDWRQQSRIVIHGTAEASRLAELVAGLLSDLGARDIEQREVDLTVDQDHVRYFHSADAVMARDLATELDDVFGRVDLRPLTRFQPSPAPGLLELWLR